MRILRWVFVCSVTLLLGGVAWAVTTSPTQPAAMAGASVLMETNSGNGSGVHIGNGYILTANHVIEGATTIAVKTDDGKSLTPEVMWVNKAYDIALLRVDPDGISSRALRCTDPLRGDSVWSLGNPLGLKFVAFYGHVAGRARPLGDWALVLPLDLTIAPGNSGGPLIDTAGRVVGIVVATMRGVPIGAAVPSSAVCRLMGRT